MKHALSRTLLLCWLLLGVSQSSADFDVDEADSLDFDSFHSEDDERRQLWKKEKVDKKEESSTGDEVKLQVRASLPDFDKAQASQTLNSLYQKMLQACPQGWDQLREWAAIDNDALYLYKEFKCRAE